MRERSSLQVRGTKMRILGILARFARMTANLALGVAALLAVSQAVSAQAYPANMKGE
jgi:hypothetical protein